MRLPVFEMMILATVCLTAGCAGLGPGMLQSTNVTSTTLVDVGSEHDVGDENAVTEENRLVQASGVVEMPKSAPAPVPDEPTPISAEKRPTEETQEAEPDGPSTESPPEEDVVQVNLPTAMSMVAGQHPIVGFAQWRVQEAYAQLAQARVLWLPTIQTGVSFHRHDGNYQASDGSVVDVNRNSFQYGLGTGATGAGTTPRPGVVAEFHLADAIFQPRIAERVAWARGHNAHRAKHDQLLAVALAYFDLLAAVQDQRILEEALERTNNLAKITYDYAESGQGLQADADRLKTEATLMEDRLYSAQERMETASANLAQALSIHTGQSIQPLELTVAPLEMVPLSMERDVLIQTGLSCRPELREAQALVAAACEQYRRQKQAPFVPSVLLGLSSGGFGGGLRNNLNDVESRYDFDAVVTWQVRNMGRGEQAARREAAARVQQARFEKIRLLDQVAREVSEAHAQVTHRLKRIEITRVAIETAANSHARNLSRIQDGQGIPLEVLHSVSALEDAQRAHLRAVTEFNQSQFRLLWAIGCQMSSLYRQSTPTE